MGTKAFNATSNKTGVTKSQALFFIHVTSWKSPCPIALTVLEPDSGF